MDKSVWKMFKNYHYLDHKHNNAADVYVCYVDDNIAGFISVLPQPCRVKNLKRVHRLVVLPDYQGIGIGMRMLDDIAKLYIDDGFNISIVSSAPSVINSLSRNKKWRCSHYGRKKGKDKMMINKDKLSLTAKRITASFRYKK